MARPTGLLVCALALAVAGGPALAHHQPGHVDCEAECSEAQEVCEGSCPTVGARAGWCREVCATKADDCRNACPNKGAPPGPDDPKPGYRGAAAAAPPSEAGS